MSRDARAEKVAEALAVLLDALADDAQTKVERVEALAAEFNPEPTP